MSPLPRPPSLPIRHPFRSPHRLPPRDPRNDIPTAQHALFRRPFPDPGILIHHGQDEAAVTDPSEVPRLAREDGYVGRREDAVAHVAALAQPAAFVAVVVAGAAVVAGVVVVLLLFAVAEGAEGDVRAGEEDAPVVVAIHGVRSRGAGVRADGVVPVVSACFAD